MYSVVLMAVLTTGVDLPDRGRRGGCCGCHGGGMGYGCGGCYGGWGGGYGCGGYGMGCHGGYGMGMGYGCGGGYGMGMGYGGGCMGYGGGMGCYGGYGMGYGGGMSMMGGGMGYGGGTILQGGTTAQPSGERAPQPKQRRDESLLPAPATILVDLPADAKLLIDNEATSSTGANRVFQSPTLNPGKEYQYTLTAQVVRDGKSVKAEKVVTVKAGQATSVALTLPTPGVAQR